MRGVADFIEQGPRKGQLRDSFRPKVLGFNGLKRSRRKKECRRKINSELPIDSRILFVSVPRQSSGQKDVTGSLLKRRVAFGLSQALLPISLST